MPASLSQPCLERTASSKPLIGFDAIALDALTILLDILHPGGYTVQ
jgi:hypothetical protein